MIVRPDVYTDTLGAILRAEIRRGVKPRPVDIGNASAAAEYARTYPKLATGDGLQSHAKPKEI